MSNRAWMPLHIADYLADTGHLTVTEHGAYMLLIMAYWQRGGLPEDERMIARMARMTPDQWAESRDRILCLFERQDNGFAPFEKAQGQHLRRNIPRQIRRYVAARDGNKCQYCGLEEGPFQIDHILPWSRGGRHDPENLALACKPCNSAKGALTADEFREAVR